MTVGTHPEIQRIYDLYKKEPGEEPNTWVLTHVGTMRLYFVGPVVHWYIADPNGQTLKQGTVTNGSRIGKLVFNTVPITVPIGGTTDLDDDDPHDVKVRCYPLWPVEDEIVGIGQ